MTNFKDDRGKSWFDVFPMLSINGQINFNISYPGTIKAFHRHKNQTDFFFCLEGEMRVATVKETVDPQADSGVDPYIHHELEIHYLSQGDLLEIESNVWHGFQVLGNEPVKMLYYVTNKFDPSEPDEERADWDAFFNWEIEKK